MLFIRVDLKLTRRVLLYVHVEVAGDIESVPLVVDHDDLSCDSLSLVSHFPAQVPVYSPLQRERVLTSDYRLVCVIICNPLSVNFYFGSWYIKYYSFIISFV